MPYHVRIRNVRGCYKNLGDMEFPDPGTAYAQALRVGRDLWRHWSCFAPVALAGMVLEVVGETGQAMLSIPFAELLQSGHVTLPPLR